MGCAVDQLVSIFSPQAALRRTFWREAYGKRSQYGAAKSPRTIGGWSPVDSPVNTVLGNSLGPVRSRVRQLVRDFPILVRAVEIGTTYTVGDGIRFQSRVKDSSGKLDKKRIQLIEDEFSFWMDEADIAGRLHYYEIMALAKRQDLETGEFLIVKKLVSEPGRRRPLALQVYEGDWLSDLAAKPANPVHLVKQGIEYDPRRQAACWPITWPTPRASAKASACRPRA